ncbi:LysR family transcriptional regulator [Lysinibacillus sp. LZ02]|uniref:LysR family transcriptional regulator n=1 Tax=Lysinibacillus sp. LZ02 TaxID=3420668 RepID=UPI003D36FC46
MEIQQLQYFKIVAQLQHMTRAAEKLSISQPALSKSISNIEQELGVPLFDRQGRSIYLNRYGELFLESVEVILAEYAKVMQEFGDITKPGHGEVAFGFIHTLGMEVVPELMAVVADVYPNMEFSLTQATSLNLLKRLEEGAIDLCLSQEIESKFIDIEWVELWSEELYVIVPAGHPLASKDRIALHEIKDEPFISIKRGNSLRQFIDKRLKEAGVVAKTTFSGEEMHTLAGFVGAGLGVSIIPNIKGLENYNIKKISVSYPSCVRKIGLAWAKGRYLSPAANEFKEFLIEYFRGES